MFAPPHTDATLGVTGSLSGCTLLRTSVVKPDEYPGRYTRESTNGAAAPRRRVFGIIARCTTTANAEHAELAETVWALV